MTHFLFVRHGQTDWNVAGRYQGHSDIPLNALGRRQAQAIAERLADVPIDAIYASPLLRAHETARHIAGPHGLAVRPEPALMEMKFGEWEGLTNAEIQQKYPLPPDEWTQRMLDSGAPGGESLRQFAARLRECNQRLQQAHPDGTVLLVTHSGAIKMLLTVLLEHPLERYWQFRVDQTSISKIATYPAGAILSLLNDTAHLNGVEA